MLYHNKNQFIERQKAKQRQAEIAKRNQPQSQKVENFPPLEDKGKSRDKVAVKIGISGRQYSKAKKIYYEAPGKPKETLVENLPQVNKREPQSRDSVAEKIGISRGYPTLPQIYHKITRLHLYQTKQYHRDYGRNNPNTNRRNRKDNRTSNNKILRRTQITPHPPFIQLINYLYHSINKKTKNRN